MLEAIKNFFRWLFGRQNTPKPQPIPEPSQPEGRYRFGYIVPHSEYSQGAQSPTGETEYQYGKKMVPLITVPHATRDNPQKVQGAAEQLFKKNCNCSIEDHKNAYNKEVSGCELLVLKGDKKSEKVARKLILSLKAYIPNLKLRANKGIKFVDGRENGAWNLREAKKGGMEIAILAEPFFIDNDKDYIGHEKLAAAYNDFFEKVNE